jgi:hypothetical protein
MMRTAFLRPEFVRAIPEKLNAGTLYVSIDFATAAHCCCCGCGREVVTPLTPTDWRITYDGVSISLFPSVGNWNFPCRSHYWIDGGRGADQWSDGMIAAGRVRDRFAKQNYYAGQQSVAPGAGAPAPASVAPKPGELLSKVASRRVRWHGSEGTRTFFIPFNGTMIVGNGA